MAVELAALEQGGKLTAERLYKRFTDKPLSPGSTSAFVICSAGMSTAPGTRRLSSRETLFLLLPGRTAVQRTVEPLRPAL